MRVVIGVDLGSTTTKAVVLDERLRTVGRGITNSRGDFAAACEIARTAALDQARMRLLADSIEAEPCIASLAEALTRSLNRSFRHEQHLAQLTRLQRACEEEAHGDRFRRFPRLEAGLEGIFAQLRSEAGQLFSPLSEPSSGFFRDVAGSSFRHHALRVAVPDELPFDTLIGLYDRAIRVAESDPGDLCLSVLGGAALQRTLDRRADRQEVESPLSAALAAAMSEEVEVMCEVGTGYGRIRLPFPRQQIRSEVLCHGLGAHTLFPNTRTVLDIGGQDTKAIQVDKRGVVTSFQMNDRCAAGCGRYLGHIAEQLDLDLDELGPTALQSSRLVRIDSTCTMLARVEVRDRLAVGQRREDILFGLHRAVVLRALSVVGRTGGIDNEFTWTGGVTRNPAAAHALTQFVAESHGDQIVFNVDPDGIYTGCLGAAVFASRLVGEV